ncbi:PREDICTED: zinc finger protein HD1 isoform X2 [Ipomoea nil]|uniref:zinc finger protein HD1 isoform X2 n=1 Tax=Ipomoea nil TaxID=35883 RepID=UPI000901FC38|nr:PREDICTED: zinc finger protein HD1 isoform X2 [Ipomoea nil]
MYGYTYTNDIHYGGYSTQYYGGANVPLPPMVVPPEALASLPLPPPLVIPGSDYDSLSPLKSEINGYSSSEYSSYGSPSSATSYGGITNFQRSISSHSLQKNTDGYYPSPTGFLDLDCSPVRKVFSTGDLPGINLAQRNHRSESPLASESNSIIEGMNKACRYSPEEKKERIERYRNKRNLRNFTKKIKYECRKTLADSRPRIRGRFARNDESCERTPQSEWNMIRAGLMEEDDDGDMDDEAWINLQMIDGFNFQQI